MRKIILAVFVSMILVPSVATLALAQTKGGHDSHGTEGGGGGGNPSGHDNNDTVSPSGDPDGTDGHDDNNQLLHPS
jgi:hypothetical protein